MSIFITLKNKIITLRDAYTTPRGPIAIRSDTDELIHAVSRVAIFAVNVLEKVTSYITSAYNDTYNFLFGAEGINDYFFSKRSMLRRSGVFTLNNGARWAGSTLAVIDRMRDHNTNGKLEFNQSDVKMSASLAVGAALYVTRRYVPEGFVKYQLLNTIEQFFDGYYQTSKIIRGAHLMVSGVEAVRENDTVQMLWTQFVSSSQAQATTKGSMAGRR